MRRHPLAAGSQTSHEVRRSTTSITRETLAEMRRSGGAATHQSWRAIGQQELACPHHGWSIAAKVRAPAGGPTLEARCRARLAGFKVPRAFLAAPPAPAQCQLLQRLPAHRPPASQSEAADRRPSRLLHAGGPVDQQGQLGGLRAGLRDRFIGQEMLAVGGDAENAPGTSA